MVVVPTKHAIHVIEGTIPPAIIQRERQLRYLHAIMATKLRL
jgi:hypothetical protein